MLNLKKRRSRCCGCGFGAFLIVLGFILWFGSIVYVTLIMDDHHHTTSKTGATAGGGVSGGDAHSSRSRDARYGQSASDSSYATSHTNLDSTINHRTSENTASDAKSADIDDSGSGRSGSGRSGSGRSDAADDAAACATRVAALRDHIAALEQRVKRAETQAQHDKKAIDDLMQQLNNAESLRDVHVRMMHGDTPPPQPPPPPPSLAVRTHLDVESASDARNDDSLSLQSRRGDRIQASWADSDTFARANSDYAHDDVDDASSVAAMRVDAAAARSSADDNDLLSDDDESERILSAAQHRWSADQFDEQMRDVAAVTAATVATPKTTKAPPVVTRAMTRGVKTTRAPPLRSRASGSGGNGDAVVATAAAAFVAGAAATTADSDSESALTSAALNSASRAVDAADAATSAQSANNDDANQVDTTNRICGLKKPLCATDDEERFLTYTVGGGFNNQRQALQRALIAAALLNRTLIVRNIWVDAKHNPGHPDGFTEFMDPATFFDIDFMQNTVRAITENDFEASYPTLFASRRHVRHTFHSSNGDERFWIDTIPCNLNAIVYGVTGKAVRRDSLAPILETYGCDKTKVVEFALLGMTKFWLLPPVWRQTAAKAVKLHKTIIAPASRLVQELGGRLQFSCIHYRQGDKLRVSPREYNYTAELVIEAALEYEHLSLDSDELIYIATDAIDKEETLAAFYDTFPGRIRTIDNYQSIVSTLPVQTMDYVGCVEIAACTHARLFFASSSTFSASVVNARHLTTDMPDTDIDFTNNIRITRMTRDYKKKFNL